METVILLPLKIYKYFHLVTYLILFTMFSSGWSKCCIFLPANGCCAGRKVVFSCFFIFFYNLSLLVSHLVYLTNTNCRGTDLCLNYVYVMHYEVVIKSNNNFWFFFKVVHDLHQLCYINASLSSLSSSKKFGNGEIWTLDLPIKYMIQ